MGTNTEIATPSKHGGRQTTRPEPSGEPFFVWIAPDQPDDAAPRRGGIGATLNGFLRRVLTGVTSGQVRIDALGISRASGIHAVLQDIERIEYAEIKYCRFVSWRERDGWFPEMILELIKGAWSWSSISIPFPPSISARDLHDCLVRQGVRIGTGSYDAFEILPRPADHTPSVLREARVFDDLATWNDWGLNELLKRVDSRQMTMVYRMGHPALDRRFEAILPARALQLVEAESDERPCPEPREREEAEREILRLAREITRGGEDRV